MCVGLKHPLFKRSFLMVSILLSGSALAANNWRYHQENDHLSNLNFSFARSPMPRTDLYDDLRMDIACKEDKKLQVIIESDVLIASQGSAFDFEYQIDQQAPVKIQMRTFPDSKRKGYAEREAKQIADALLSGQSIFIRVNTMIRRVLSGQMPLDDAAGPIKQVFADCGLDAGSPDVTTGEYNLKQFNADFNKLSVEKQRELLRQLQNIMVGKH